MDLQEALDKLSPTAKPVIDSFSHQTPVIARDPTNLWAASESPRTSKMPQMSSINPSSGLVTSVQAVKLRTIHSTVSTVHVVVPLTGATRC